jgi:hypothetical protein
MAFVFDSTRLQPSGLACELVVPREWLNEIGEDALKIHLASTPYAVSFRKSAQHRTNSVQKINFILKNHSIANVE